MNIKLPVASKATTPILSAIYTDLQESRQRACSLAKCPRRTILKSGFCYEISESTIFPASDWNNFWLGPIMLMEGERAPYIKLGQSYGSKEDSCRCCQNKSTSSWVTFLKNLIVKDTNMKEIAILRSKPQCLQFDQ